MSLIKALRDQYPEYERYSDEEITSFLSGVGMEAPTIQTEQAGEDEGRTWGEFASDTGSSIMGGFANLGGDLAEIVDTGANLVGVDVDLGISEAANRASDYWQDQKSDSLKLAYDQLGAADGFIETLASVADRPELIPDIIAGSIPYLLPTGAAARIMRGGKSAATAVAGIGGLLEGANASRESKKTVDDLTPEQLAEGSEQYRTMLESGMTPERAKEEIRKKTGLTAFAFTAPIAMLAGKLTGAAKLETDFFTGKGVGSGVGRFSSVLAKEGGEEIIQEGSNALGSNLGVQTHADSTQDLGEGVGQAAALGLVAGAGQAAPIAITQGLIPPLKQAESEIQKAGEQVAEAGGDSLDQAVAKGQAQQETVPSAVAESAKLKMPEQSDYSGLDVPTANRNANAGPQQPRGKWQGIDRDILTANREGFHEEQIRLTNAKRLYERAERKRQAGDIEGANKDIHRANQIHESVIGANETIKSESTYLPAPYVSEGEIQGGELATTPDQPNWTQPEIPIQGRAEEVIPELELSGAKLPQGTGQINMGREYTPPQAQPIDPLYDGVGENVVQRQAPATGLPQPGVSQEQIIDIQNQERKPAQDLAGVPLDSDWSAFAADTGTKGIPRSDMPQIKAEHRGAMTNFMNARGIAHEQQEVPASELKPTQAEFSHEKVKKAMEYEGGDRSILVSSDGYVLDGHHQWLAKREQGQSIKIIRLDAPIEKLIPLAHEFPSSEVAAGVTQASESKSTQSETQADLSVENDTQAASKEEAKRELPIDAEPNSNTSSMEKEPAAKADAAEVKETGSGVALFSRDRANSTDNTAVLSVDAVESVASNIARRFKLRGVSINTVATESDLPADILKQAAEHGAEGEIGAVLHQGSIYLVADKMPDATAVETTIWHELAHYGGHKVFGKDINKAYRKLALQLGGLKGIQAKAEELGVSDVMEPYFKSAESKPAYEASVYLIDELLSHANQVQASEKIPARIKRAFQEFYGAIRDMLRRWNFKELPDLTDSDLAFLLKQINKAAQKGEGSVDAPQFMRVSESEELSMFFADLASTIDEQPAFSRAGRVGSDRADWSDFPDVVFQANLGSTKEHPDYEAAKSGDAEAAVNVVKSVLNDDSISQIKDAIGDGNPIVVPVIAQEKSGANMLPLTYAHALASKLGLSVDADIIQSIKASHTDAKAFHRIGVQAVFDGHVEPGAEYIIVDDTMAMGGTLANLRGHIEANGGTVVMASTLTGFPSASKIGVSDKLKNKLLDKHGDELNEYLQSEFGFGIDSLTQGEAGHLNASPSIDAIRERISEAQDAAGINLSGDREVLDTAFSRVANPEEQSNNTVRSTVRDVIDSWRFQMQDKFIDLKRKQQEVGEVDDEANAYQKAAIWEGKAGEQLNDFDEQRVQPLLEQVAQTGLDLDQVGEWLVARHAEEANEYLAEINPDKSEDERYRLSGMSNDEASAILDKYQENTELQELGETIDQINRDRVSMLVDRGLISQSDADAWQGRYEHYVPLKREEADEGFLPSRGQGFSMKGKESKQRTGSAYWTPGKILSNVIANYEQSIIRSEKNEVGKALLKFVEQNPDDNFWTVVTERKRSEVRNGKVIEVTDNREGPADFSVKVDGVQYMIEFNTSNEKSKRLVEGLKNLQVSEMGSVMRGLASVTRFLATINTSWNPEFMVSNFFRDAQTAAYNLSDTELKDMEGRVLKDIFPAMNGIRNALFGDGSSEWADVWEDFRKSGGKTGWLDLHSDIQAKEKDLKKMVKRLQDGKPSKMAIMRFVKGVEDMNNVIENAVRLSAYKHSLEAGLSKDKAAALAKDLTVNFNRKGNKGPVINAMYMFFNAAIQGNVRLLQAMAHSKKGRVLALSTVGFAVMLDMVNRSLSGEDDDGENIYDTLPDHIKDRNIIIMGEKEPIVKIPAPWGYNVLHVLGQEIGSSISNDRFDALESGSRAVMSVADAFNPVGSGTFLQMVSPTILDPAVQIGENKNFFGSPLKPEHTFDAFRPRPEYQMHFSNARDVSKDLTKWLNDISGGNEVRPGAINWSPEVVDMLFDTVTGGLGRTVADTGDFAGKLVSGDEIEVSRIPFVRKVTGANTDYGVKGRYYEWSRDIGYASQELKQLKGEDLHEARRSPQFKLIGLHKATEKKLRSLRKIRKALMKNNASEDRIEKIDEKIRKVMSQFNKQYAKAIYKG